MPNEIPSTRAALGKLSIAAEPGEPTECVVACDAGEYRTAIEFNRSPDEVHGFGNSQFVHYSLTTHSIQPGDTSRPRQTLTLAFSTADVTLQGSKLEPIYELLGKGQLAAVKKVPIRYAERHRGKTCVSEISIAWIQKQ